MKFSDNAICSVNVEEDSVQEELDKFQDWNNRNRMNLNNPKGEVRHFRTHGFSPSRKLWKKTWEWTIWLPDDTICDVPTGNINVIRCITWGTCSKDKYGCHFVTQLTSEGSRDFPNQKSPTFLEHPSGNLNMLLRQNLISVWKLIQQGAWRRWRQQSRRALLGLISYTAHAQLGHSAWLSLPQTSMSLNPTFDEK